MDIDGEDVRLHGDDHLQYPEFCIPLILFFVLISYVMKRMGGGAMGVGKSNARSMWRRVPA